EHEVLLELLQRTGWGRTGADPQVAPPGSPTPLPPTAMPHFRDTAQTHIVLGSTTVAHSDPRRYAVILAALLLGGGMSSRLFQRIREEMGLAYSVFTFQSFHSLVGSQGVYVGTSAETAAAALDAVRTELAALVRDGFSREE